VISTGSVALSSRNVGTAHDAVVGIVSRYGGTVAQDDTSVDDHGRAASSDLTVRVPADDFAAAMTALKGLGRLTSAGQSTEDVTTQVIDTRVRVRAQQRSLRRMERLFDSAASVATVLRIENALTRRQADLDSLLRQQAYLADQTALATITVSITRSEPLTVADRAGFLGGLAKGWNSLVGALALALTALGVLLPWVLAASVVGLPLALLVRRHRQTTTDAA
jgi:hypothetical protein